MRASHAKSMFVAGIAVVLSAACTKKREASQASVRNDQGASPSDQRLSTPLAVKSVQPLPNRFATIGRRASGAEIRAWNIDANSGGVGLPDGRGTYAQGAATFAARCASCHGARGEGIPPFPKLIGREPREGFPFGRDPTYSKTIGNYWPYATTLYDYVNRAMPFTAPGSLRPNDVYGVVAFLLGENEIIDRRVVLDAKTLRAIRMPARDHFVRDNRLSVASFR